MKCTCGIGQGLPENKNLKSNSMCIFFSNVIKEKITDANNPSILS